MSSKVGLGWVKDPYDYRDYSIYKFISAVPLPKKFNLLDKYSPSIRNQGYRGACVGFSMAYIQDWQESVEREKDIVTSPRFVYSECKARDGLPYMEGTHLRIACQVVNELGIALEECCRYSFFEASMRCPSCYDSAIEFKDDYYARLNNIFDIKQAIYQTGPIFIGVPVYPSIKLTGPDGLIPMPQSGESQMGGHALAIFGWDDELEILTLLNSWGVAWGNKGRGKLPYEYWNMHEDVSDAWKSIDKKQLPSPEPPEPPEPVNMKVLVGGNAVYEDKIGKIEVDFS